MQSGTLFRLPCPFFSFPSASCPTPQVLFYCLSLALGPHHHVIGHHYSPSPCPLSQDAPAPVHSWRLRNSDSIIYLVGCDIWTYPGWGWGPCQPHHGFSFSWLGLPGSWSAASPRSSLCMKSVVVFVASLSHLRGVGFGVTWAW